MPACEEMASRYGLPRTRGDQPYTHHVYRAAAEAAPHARGSTPMGRRSSRDQRQLPRTRGDEPLAPKAANLHLQAAPHPRGWTAWTAAHDPSASAPPAGRGCTRWLTARLKERFGYPVRAGIHPTLRASSARGLRLPRAGEATERRRASTPANSGPSPHTGGIDAP